METNGRRRWGIRAAAAALFLLGCLAGALSVNIYRAYFLRFPRETRGERFEQILDGLNLTAEQRAQVKRIITDSRSQIMEIRRQSEPRYKEIRQQTDEKLQAVLTSQQWQQWQLMTRDIRERNRSFRPRR